MVIWYFNVSTLDYLCKSITNIRQEFFLVSLSKIWLINVSRAHLIHIDIKPCESWNVLLGLPPFVILHNNDLFSLLAYFFTETFNYENNYVELKMEELVKSELRNWKRNNREIIFLITFFFYLFYNSYSSTLFFFFP